MTPRQKFKGFGEKPNPEKEKELRDFIIKQETEKCPFKEWCLNGKK